MQRFEMIITMEKQHISTNKLQTKLFGKIRKQSDMYMYKDNATRTAAFMQENDILVVYKCNRHSHPSFRRLEENKCTL